MTRKQITGLAAIVAGISLWAGSLWLAWRCETDIKPESYRLACSAAIHGKGVDGDCMDYAVALSKTLARAGIHGRLIFYTWQITDAAPDAPNTRGAHVFIQYDDDGRRYIVDNEHKYPIEVNPESSMMDEIYTLAGGRYVGVWVQLTDSLNRLSFF